MNIKGEITQANIKNGRRGSPGYCALALSLKDQGYDLAEVMQFGFSVAKGPEVHYGHLPKKIVRWVSDFDHNNPVNPIRYQLRCAS